jgi:hypothetical protein
LPITPSPHEPAGERRRKRQRAAAAAALLAFAAGAALAVDLSRGGGQHPARQAVPSGPPAKTTPTTASSATISTAPVASFPATPGPPGLPASGQTAFGVNVNRLFNDRTDTPTQINAQLDAARADGVRLARSDALWELTEPQPPADNAHRYDWTFDDGVASALAAHRIRWLPIIDYSAVWAATAAGTTHAPPKSDDDFGAFAHAFAQRYGPAGSFWRAHPGLPPLPVNSYEIWNEPDNLGFWARSPSPAGYTALYLSARAAIKQVHSDARVLIGGLTDPVHFLPQLIAARPDARGHVDGVAIHTYGLPLSLVGKVRDARRTLESLGMGAVPLYVTEFGWVTSPRSSLKYAPAAARPGYIASTIDTLARVNCGLGAVILYTWVTPEHDPASEEDWFGVEHPDATPSPSSRALARALAAAQAHAGAPIRLCS